MNGFFNFLKSLFSGILGIFSKKSNSNAANQIKPRRDPKSKYFLELDEAKNLITDSARPQAEKEAETEARKAGSQPVAAKSQSTASNTDLQPSVAKADLQSVATKSDPQPGATRSEKATAVKASPTIAAQAEPDAAATAKALNLPQPTITTFAPNYLTPTNTNGRRRPGANMSSYLNMAREAKTPG